MGKTLFLLREALFIGLAIGLTIIAGILGWAELGIACALLVIIIAGALYARRQRNRNHYHLTTFTSTLPRLRSPRPGTHPRHIP